MSSSSPSSPSEQNEEQRETEQMSSSPRPPQQEDVTASVARPLPTLPPGAVDKRTVMLSWNGTERHIEIPVFDYFYRWRPPYSVLPEQVPPGKLMLLARSPRNPTTGELSSDLACLPISKKTAAESSVFVDLLELKPPAFPERSSSTTNTNATTAPTLSTLVLEHEDADDDDDDAGTGGGKGDDDDEGTLLNTDSMIKPGAIGLVVYAMRWMRKIRAECPTLDEFDRNGDFAAASVADREKALQNLRERWIKDHLDGLLFPQPENMIPAVIAAASYLNFPELEHSATTRAAIDIAKCETKEELRRKYGIVSDFSQEQEAYVNATTAWAEGGGGGGQGDDDMEED